ncbi:hypothetical protein LLG90_11895 [Aromatoleum toluclasticum]|uniref:hypothetical protein n=1 Tax=Aromatoleum toluclasticum TaxID=92003 RepID=UPI001D186C2F|nr:hypothetical protein [Aromatoleum toluclasticum]MCC4116052.1 hypothetical protein [Aromatoleum toluclasticum]
MANSCSISCRACSSGDRGLQGGRSRRRATGIVLFLFALASTLAAGPGFARESAPARAVKESVTVPGYVSARDKRRAELRRALMSGTEATRPAAQEPRRLSPEQREELYQELRQAMRDANRPRSVMER